MKPANYTQRERGVMLTLMAEAQPLSTGDLKQRFRLELTRSSREKLVKAGLIEVGSTKNAVTKRRSMTFGLTDRGWAWAGDELARDLPSGHQGQGPLYAILNGLARYLDRNQLVLADVFGRTTSPAPTETSLADLESRVRGAYVTLADRPGAMVKLADLREHLLDVPRSDLDMELKRLVRARRILLEPNDNAADVTARDRDAALPLGGEPNHWMAVR